MFVTVSTIVLSFISGIVMTFVALYFLIINGVHKSNRLLEIKRAEMRDENAAHLKNILKQREESSYSTSTNKSRAFEQQTPINSQNIGLPDTYLDPGDIKVMGKIRIQLGGKKKTNQRVHAVLKGTTLYYTPIVGRRSSKIRRISEKALEVRDSLKLEGCFIRKSEITKYCMEIYHVNRKITPKIDYIYIICSSERKFDKWWEPLILIFLQSDNESCSGTTTTVESDEKKDISQLTIKSEELTTSSTIEDSPESSNNLTTPPEVVPPKQNKIHSESADWANAILQRFFDNWKLSEDMVTLIKTKLALLAGAKFIQKGYDNFLKDITVLEVFLGNNTIKFTSVRFDSTENGELTVDFDIDYEGGMKMVMACDLCIRNTTVPFTGTASVDGLSGTLRMHCLPFPAERFSLGFVEEPFLDLNMVISGSAFELMQSLIPKIDEVPKLIIRKLKNVLNEKLVLPNRRYFDFPVPKQNVNVPCTTTTLPNEQ